MKNKLSDPLISIIVPVYNTDLYLKRCIESILEQTYDNIEVLCIDDGSTDQSGLILDEFSEHDSRIKVIHTENKGVSSARNIALALSMGDYIGFVDSDDYIHKDMYKNLVKLIMENDVDFVSCSYWIDDEIEIRKAINQEVVPDVPLTLNETLYYIYKRDKYKGVAGYLWTRLFKKELIKNSEGNLLVQFDKDLNVGQDIVFLAEICKNVKKTLYTDQALYYYFQRSNSTVHDNVKQLKSMSWIHAYERIINIYKDMQMPEDLLDTIIRMYVYRCGKLLEIAYEYNDKNKINILIENIRNYLPHYIKTNLDHVERVQWIQTLICEKDEK